MNLLKVENVKAGYRDKVILDNISFAIDKGELTGLLGLNGSGKTTLLKTICGLIKPTFGKCFVGGKDYYLLKDKERAKHISYMPQRHSIIYDTIVLDVVLMGITPYLGVFETPNKEHRKLAYKMLESIAMEKFANLNFLHLSEGQKQLIIIARALMQNSEIMLFDEPDSALDFQNSHMVLSKIKEVVKNENKAGIITLHDPNFALNYCDKIIVINDSKIMSQFSVSEVDIEFLNILFKKIYGPIDIIKYNEKFIIMRLEG